MGVSQFFLATVDERLPIFSDQILKAGVYLNWLKEKGRVRFNMGGDGGSFQVRKTRGGTVRAIGDNTVGQARTKNTGQKISFDYAAYGDELMVSRLQIKRNEGAGATGKVYDFFEQQLNETYQDFEEYLNTDIVGLGTQAANDEAAKMDGLQELNLSTGTYLGVARATETWWASNTRAVTNNFLDDDDADGVVNGLVSLRLAYMDACKGGSDSMKGVNRTVGTAKAKPDGIYTNQTTYANICTAMQPQQQYTGGSKNDPGAEIAFFGTPVLWDTFAAADRLDILNSKAIELLVVGSSLIYRDCEDELGLAGTPRATAIGLVSQLQHLSYRPSLLSYVTNTD